jgi:hypothetical protein
MSVGLRTQSAALRAAHGMVWTLALMFAGCGSASEPEGEPNSTPSIPVVGNYPASGGAGQSSSGDGWKGWRSAAAGSSGAVATGPAAGSSSASATAGSSASAAGSGGSAGTASATAAAAGTKAAAGSGAADEDDALDIFGQSSGAASCDGLVCVEDQDCKDLYPEESAACTFTQCVDFACK